MTSFDVVFEAIKSALSSENGAAFPMFDKTLFNEFAADKRVISTQVNEYFVRADIVTVYWIEVALDRRGHYNALTGERRDPTHCVHLIDVAELSMQTLRIE